MTSSSSMHTHLDERWHVHPESAVGDSFGNALCIISVSHNQRPHHKVCHYGNQKPTHTYIITEEREGERRGEGGRDEREREQVN